MHDIVSSDWKGDLFIFMFYYDEMEDGDEYKPAGIYSDCYTSHGDGLIESSSWGLTLVTSFGRLVLDERIPEK